MIARLTGTIDELKPTEAVIDVHGVGYRVMIPFSTYEKIMNSGQVTLHIYTMHREDQFRLFGFFTEEEKKFFSLLIDISGIGPSMAMSILSAVPIADFIGAVQNGNLGLLMKIPGIGKSKAEKLIFELKRKMKKFDELSIPDSGERTIRNDVLEALASLGFDENKISPVIDEILKEDSGLSLEKAVKESLKRLSV